MHTIHCGCQNGCSEWRTPSQLASMSFPVIYAIMPRKRAFWFLCKALYQLWTFDVQPVFWFSWDCELRLVKINIFITKQSTFPSCKKCNVGDVRMLTGLSSWAGRRMAEGTRHDFTSPAPCQVLDRQSVVGWGSGREQRRSGRHLWDGIQAQSGGEDIGCISYFYRYFSWMQSKMSDLKRDVYVFFSLRILKNILV